MQEQGALLLYRSGFADKGLVTPISFSLFHIAAGVHGDRCFLVAPFYIHLFFPLAGLRTLFGVDLLNLLSIIPQDVTLVRDFQSFIFGGSYIDS